MVKVLGRSGNALWSTWKMSLPDPPLRVNDDEGGAKLIWLKLPLRLVSRRLPALLVSLVRLSWTDCGLVVLGRSISQLAELSVGPLVLVVLVVPFVIVTVVEILK